ncbi:hypothetical protein EUAN_00910 [Andreesenia angusta]|uniref:S1 motif domain-containing protein n=1 Tax=Andreesenia angusta TaxID=39480 RepID=A0A1S1VAL0_9FIRM|nr:S1-like domain-containing RNA-binding protein [Andreesenia angusta]OHW63227.1 hypothetical protein EUAN_00910 [Andreesenia angusta]
MIELGRKQFLTVKREVSIGLYLGTEGVEGEAILLPKSQIIKPLKPGDSVEVFVYKDSEDRMVATMKQPKLQVGEIGMLQVADVAKIGAFLDWGLEKDLFLPFKEQLGKVKKEAWIMVGLYIDKSSRICATMKIYDLLSMNSPYNENDKVKGIVYEVKPGLGALIAVDGKYHGLVHENELYEELKIGNSIEARVVKKRADGKLDLSIRKKAYRQMDKDAKMIIDELKKKGGTLHLCDKSSPEEIESTLNMSKNAFKRAVGKLYKLRKVEIKADRIELKK